MGIMSPVQETKSVKPQASPATKPQVSFSHQVQQADLIHWKDLQTRVGNVTTAKLIVEFLNAQHPSFQAAHMGVYLRARETIARDQIRGAKYHFAGKLTGQAVRGAGIAVRFVFRMTMKMVMWVATDLPQNQKPAESIPPIVAAQPVTQQQVWPVLFESIDRSQPMH